MRSISLVLAVLLLLAGCAGPGGAPGNPDESAVGETTETETAPAPAEEESPAKEESPSEEELLAEARRLFEAHLQSYMGSDKPERSRLKDYRIRELKIWRETSGPVPLVMVSFDVLPAVPDSNWWAGNGTEGEGGWIVSKLLFLRLVREDGAYRIAGMGTGP